MFSEEYLLKKLSMMSRRRLAQHLEHVYKELYNSDNDSNITSVNVCQAVCATAMPDVIAKLYVILYVSFAPFRNGPRTSLGVSKPILSLPLL